MTLLADAVRRAPAASLVEYLVEQGFDVYLLDWGSPGGETRGL